MTRDKQGIDDDTLQGVVVTSDAVSMSIGIDFEESVSIGPLCEGDESSQTEERETDRAEPRDVSQRGVNGKTLISTQKVPKQ